MSTTTADLPGGITAKERDALLKELAADPTNRTKKRAFTAREKVIASLLRDRDHFDGCPVIVEGDALAAQVEAYEEVAAAPGKSLRERGAIPGSPIVVARCITCAATRYFVSELPPHIPVGENRHVSALITKTLNVEAADADLDASL